MAMHDWARALGAWRASHGLEGGDTNPSATVIDYGVENTGATIMGRNMFGGGPGPWNGDEWKGWWGDDPPYHTPVFVLTNHARDPLVMEGGTTFHFVTDGIDSALAQAREAAGEKDVVLGGGAQTVQQFLAAGLVDEFFITVAPLILGDGERLLNGLDPANLQLAQEELIEGDGVTHIKYSVVRSEP
jgi:dihydrofolate reductase